MKLGRTLTQCYDRCHRMPSPTPLCISFFGQIGSHWKTLLPRMVSWGVMGCPNQTPALTIALVCFGGCFHEDYERFVARPYWTLVDPPGTCKISILFWTLGRIQSCGTRENLICWHSLYHVWRAFSVSLRHAHLRDLASSKSLPSQH